MVLKCTKCNNTFNSLHNLEKHLNRKIPCNIILQCTRCNKVFKTIRDLNSHENRKFPCKITDLNFEREEREKDRELKLKLVLEREREITIRTENYTKLKLHLETEKNIRKDQENAIKEKALLVEQEKILARTANLQIQKEIVQLQCNAKLELVQAKQNNKIALKEQYPSSITNITNITNVFINNIKDACFDINDTCFTQITKHRELMYKTVMCYNRNSYRNNHINWFIDVFNSYATTSEMVKHFLRHAYVNDIKLNTRCIFYHDIIKQFYAIYITATATDKDVKQLQVVDYDKDLHKEFISCIKEYITGMLAALKQQNYCDPNNKTHTKSINTICEMEKLTIVLNNTRYLACSVLDISNEDLNGTKLKYITYKEKRKEEKRQKKENKTKNIKKYVFSDMSTSESE